MNITELKELAEKATPGPWLMEVEEEGEWARQWPTIYSFDEDEIIGTEGFYGVIEQSINDASYVAAANPAAILELIAQLEGAQGEIRALRATEAGLRERVKELEEGLRLCVHTIELANWGEDFTAINARALLEKKE